MKIAFIGIGVMGKGMVNNLLKGNHSLRLYNRTFEKAKALEGANVKACTSITECVEDAEVVMTMVGYPKDVEEVYDEIFKCVKPKTICIDFTTSSPSLAQDLYQKGKKLDVAVLDAPVSGGDIGAQKGTLSIMVGGDEDIYHQVTPLLKLMGTTLNYMGPAGMGQHTKMCNQICVAGAITSLTEAIAYAQANDLDPEKMLQAIAKGAAGSWQIDNNGPKILAKDYAPGFFNKHFVKDMKIAVEESENKDLHLNLLNAVLNMYEAICEDGLENEGTQALIKYYE